MEIGVVNPYAAQSTQGDQLLLPGNGMADILPPIQDPEGLVEDNDHIQNGEFVGDHAEGESNDDRVEENAKLKDQASGDL